MDGDGDVGVELGKAMVLPRNPRRTQVPHAILMVDRNRSNGMVVRPFLWQTLNLSCAQCFGTGLARLLYGDRSL